MQVRRGDGVLALYLFAVGRDGSRRQVLVVQNDRDNEQLPIRQWHKSPPMCAERLSPAIC
jgi:hypothetical protein